MQLTQTFIADESELSGEMGFRPENCSEAFDALNYAPGLAHDFIEHAGNFSVEGEIMAHGAMYFVRYETGFTFPPYHHPLTIMAIGSEWENLYRGIEADGCLSRCEPQKRLDSAIEEDLKEIISQGKRIVLNYIGKEDLDTDIYTQMSQNFADWFRKGYREARGRFAHIGNFGAADALQAIVGHFEDALGHAISPGDKINVTLDLESGELAFERFTECVGCGRNCEDGICEECID